MILVCIRFALWCAFACRCCLLWVCVCCCLLAFCCVLVINSVVRACSGEFW